MKSLLYVMVFAACALCAPHVSAETAEEKAAARQAFVKGDAAFRANRFEEALSAFEEGYALSRRPRFLLNIGHTQRKLGHMREALASYRRFLLTDPKPDDQALARQMVTEIEALLAEEAALAPQQATQPPPPAPEPMVAAPPVVLEAEAPDEGADKPVYHRWYFWAGVTAVVAAGVIAALALGGGGSDDVRSGSWGELRL